MCRGYGLSVKSVVRCFTHRRSPRNFIMRKAENYLDRLFLWANGDKGVKQMTNVSFSLKNMV